jgi:hypothetical protein
MAPVAPARCAGKPYFPAVLEAVTHPAFSNPKGFKG